MRSAGLWASGLDLPFMGLTNGFFWNPSAGVFFPFTVPHENPPQKPNPKTRHPFWTLDQWKSGNKGARPAQGGHPQTGAAFFSLLPLLLMHLCFSPPRKLLPSPNSEISITHQHGPRNGSRTPSFEGSTHFRGSRFREI